MSDKAAKKKQFILDTAKSVFAKKGFKDVTMKDIVEACEISRGGLYLYFDNTESILLECLGAGEDNPEPYKDKAPGEALALFLNGEKQEILAKQENLSIAIYEYLFLKKSMGECDNFGKTRFEKAVSIVAKLIDEGVETEEFYCEDSTLAAQNIMYTIEGMKIMGQTVGITEADVDNELLYILSGLIAEE